MSRRTYLLLLVIRLIFALQPSFIHPDEHFQGPEIITGEVFGWPIYRTWEFTSTHPIRSVFPIFLIYGPPLTILKWISNGLGYETTPIVAFYALRTFMLLLSFVLGDWALHELLPDPRERSSALILNASSYVTWTYQMHTFSNSVETVIVLWCLVLMRRMPEDLTHTQVRLCTALGSIVTLGIFNRITFPAFLLVAGMQCLPEVMRKPLRLPILLAAAVLTASFAIAVDTTYYIGNSASIREFLHAAVITPLNNLAYNLDSENLAQHGLHSFGQHLFANLPQLIGPAFPLLLFARKGTRFWSGLVGIAILSCFRHQEARFLLPAVPLLLTSIRTPAYYTRVWISCWIAFNLLAAALFGVYHQGGVVPVQDWIGRQTMVTQALWWKTYSPPRWLLGHGAASVNTTDLMGMETAGMLASLEVAAQCPETSAKTVLVAPQSAKLLHARGDSVVLDTVRLQRIHGHKQHVGLDDLDWGDDGVLPTLRRVIGGRGLDVWEVTKPC